MAQKVTISNEKNWTKTGSKILCNHFIVSSVVLILYFLKNIFNRLMNKPVAKRHQMVTGSLALLNCFFYCFLYSYFNGSRAAAPVGDEVL